MSSSSANETRRELVALLARSIVPPCLEVRAFDEARAHRAGAMLGRARTTDVVDASVVALALEDRAEIVTTDPEDITRLVAASGKKIRVTAR
jgi:hypothetical protein